MGGGVAQAPSRSDTWQLLSNARWRCRRGALVRSQPAGMTSCDRGGEAGPRDGAVTQAAGMARASPIAERVRGWGALWRAAAPRLARQRPRGSCLPPALRPCPRGGGGARRLRPRAELRTGKAPREQPGHPFPGVPGAHGAALKKIKSFSERTNFFHRIACSKN